MIDIGNFGDMSPIGWWCEESSGFNVLRPRFVPRANRTFLKKPSKLIFATHEFNSHKIELPWPGSESVVVSLRVAGQLFGCLFER